MEKKAYDLEENISEEQLKAIVLNVFSETNYIYFMISDAHSELKDELTGKYVRVAEDEEFIIGYIKDDQLNFLYEFFERGTEVPFILTKDKIPLSFENIASYDYDRFYNLFQNNHIPHMKSGPDMQSLLHYYNA